LSGNINSHRTAFDDDARVAKVKRTCREIGRVLRSGKKRDACSKAQTELLCAELIDGLQIRVIRVALSERRCEIDAEYCELVINVLLCSKSHGRTHKKGLRFHSERLKAKLIRIV